MNSAELKLFSGSASVKLSMDVANELGVQLSKVQDHEFADGEIFVELAESVRGADVFVIQSTCTPVNTNYMQLFLLIDAFKRASAKRINVIMPYFGYSRQERLWGRSPISASLLARFIERSGADAFMSFDMHNASIAGFFNIPVDNPSTTGLFAQYFSKKKLKDLAVVSPDVGGAKRAQKLSQILGAELAIVHKQRPSANKAEAHSVVGEVEGRNCILTDDIVDTAGSICAAAQALKEKGAQRIFAAVTHPVLSGDAIDKIENSPIEEMVVTDSIPLKAAGRKMAVISLAPKIAESIRRIHAGGSISQLFDQ